MAQNPRGQSRQGEPGPVLSYHDGMVPDPSQLRILHHPHPVLRQRAEAIAAVDDQVRALARRMLVLMAEAEGIGLAAPQVGLPWRMFVTRDPLGETDGIVWINPVLEVVEATPDMDEEGCLSLPGITVRVTRPTGMRIRGLDATGREVEARSNDHMARVWQHETDHLDGRLIIDHMSSMDRIRNRRALRDLERG